MSKKILYAEDDSTLSFIVCENLQRSGYEVICCDDGEKALKEFTAQSFDICLLDVMLPKLDGFTLAEEIRKANPEIPIIFLTAKSLHEDKIKGLVLGADDYIIKPFSVEELELKIGIFLSRAKKTDIQTNATEVPIGTYLFSFNNLLLKWKSTEIKLTYREGELLQLLLKNKNRLLKREIILTELWNENDYFLGRSMDVFISRLRKYLKKDRSLSIENVHGVGYIFKDKSEKKEER